MRRQHSGFSLVEILVGVAIAMIGMVVMFQSLQNWEARKRTTSSGSDAQISGSIALYSLERDIKMAGFGFSGATQIGCTVKGYDTSRAGAIPDFQLVPVLITQGASGAADTLTLLYGNAATTGGGYEFVASTDQTKDSNNVDGLKPGDLFIAADMSNHCDLLETTANPIGGLVTITHATTGTYTNYKNQSVAVRYNNAGVMTTASSPSGNLYNLGPTPRLNVWRISNGRLTVNNVLTNETANDIADSIIDLQADYLDASGAPIFTLAQPSTVDEWRTIRAIRVALLARSQHYDPALRSANPQWRNGAGGSALVSFTMRNVDGSADNDPDAPNNWRRYRYRVYETVVPLRNVAWGGT